MKSPTAWAYLCKEAYEMGRCGPTAHCAYGRQIRVEEARLISWIESGRAVPCRADEKIPWLDECLCPTRVKRKTVHSRD